MSDATAKPPAPDEEQPKLRPANENPWYLLATLHGEQGARAEFGVFDEALQEQNRIAWNRFIVGKMQKKEINALFKLVDKNGSRRFLDQELRPFYQEDIDTVIKSMFVKRGGTDIPSGMPDFSCTKFDFMVHFDNFIIPDASFEFTKFSKDAFFHGVCFLGNLNFKKTSFLGNVKFDSCFFYNYTQFDSSYFYHEVDFQDSEFLDFTSFEDAVFFGYANFGGATFSDCIWFHGAKFNFGLNFQRAQFRGETVFDQARFKVIPPDFNGAPTLFEGTIWPAREGWPPAPSSTEAARGHQIRYERLKKDAETHKKHRQEQFFFTKELECQQVIDGPWRGWPTKLYGLLSDYGTSIAKPLKALAAIWGVGGVAYENLTSMTVTQAWGFSAASLFDVLGARKNFFEAEMKSMSGLAAIIATSQTAFGLLFLFLIGLALRNRFRMK